MAQVVEIVEVNFTDQEAKQSNQITGDRQVQVFRQLAGARYNHHAHWNCSTTHFAKAIQESYILFSYYLTMNKWYSVDRNSLGWFIHLTFIFKDDGEKMVVS